MRGKGGLTGGKKGGETRHRPRERGGRSRPQCRKRGKGCPKGERKRRVRDLDLLSTRRRRGSKIISKGGTEPQREKRKRSGREKK